MTYKLMKLPNTGWNGKQPETTYPGLRATPACESLPSHTPALMWTRLFSTLHLLSATPDCCLGGALSDSALHSRSVLFRVGSRLICLWRQAINNKLGGGWGFHPFQAAPFSPTPRRRQHITISHMPNKWVAVQRGKLTGWKVGPKPYIVTNRCQQASF